MYKMIETLKRQIEGEVRSDKISRRIYSVDASIYEVEPLCVVLPKSTQDIITVVKLAREAGISVIPRGAATGITGGCLGGGIVLDLSKYLNGILHLDEEAGVVVCEPGVVQDRLNEYLATKGLRLGPDTSTGNRATIGGMLANNAAGSRSLVFGSMVDAVQEVEMVLASGELVRFYEVDETQFAAKCSTQGTEGHIYRTVKKICEEYKEEIESRFPKIPRRVSGYNLDQLIQSGPLNLSKLIAGSEGTLGIATEITLRVVPVLKGTGLCVVHLHDMIEGMRAIEDILAYKPMAVEMIDRNILEMGKRSPAVKDCLGWLEGDPEAVFAIELDKEKLAACADELKRKGIGYAHVCLTESAEIEAVWKVRKAGLGLLLSKRSYSRAIAFIEDISVAPERLADFMIAFQQEMRKVGKEAGIYGHVGSGCMHIRPYMDMRSEAELQLMEQIMRRVTALLLVHEGSLSGEHGDGLVRSWLNPQLFGAKIYQAFTEIKDAFDPENRMNPGKIVYGEPFREHLRVDSKTPIQEIETFLDFSKEGGFSLSADLCNGNGQCRKKSETMCPSFQASNDEYHTTRARAQTLRGIITGRLPKEELTGEALKDVLDLCIECKGCKKECPSQVDMAKMKAEVLYQYQEKHGYSLRDRIFAFIGRINQLGSAFPWLVNIMMSTRLFGFLGIASERSLPKLAPFRFSKWAQLHPSPETDNKVVLFSDTFTEFNAPEVGIAAKKVLEALGYTVIVPTWQCCGRTLISKGFLWQAKGYAAALIEVLDIFAKAKIPIIGLEPSCLLAIKDDFQGLLGYQHTVLQEVIKHCTTFDAFIAGCGKKLPFKDVKRKVKLHGHCHQKALVGTGYALQVLRSMPNLSVEEIPTGCCGMAGSFGYEKEHYEFSIKIASLQLVPALKDLEENVAVIADGFSCRHQIEHVAHRKSVHLAEFLLSAIEKQRM